MSKKFVDTPMTVNHRLRALVRLKTVLPLLLLLVMIFSGFLLFKYNLFVNCVPFLYSTSVILVLLFCILKTLVRQDFMSIERLYLSDDKLALKCDYKYSTMSLEFTIDKRDIKECKYNKFLKRYEFRADVDVCTYRRNKLMRKRILCNSFNTMWDYYSDNGYIGEWLGITDRG